MIRPQLFAACAVQALALLHAVPALAAGSGESTPIDLGSAQRDAPGSTGGGGILRTLVGLVVVVAVIYGLYWVLRQVRSSRDVSAAGSGLASVASLPLGPGRSVHLVRAGRELVLVGSSEHGVAALRVYGPDEARDAGLLEDHPGDDDPPTAPPAARLRDLIARLQQRTERG
jgi:flagellar protein FliO/FliZ